MKDLHLPPEDERLVTMLRAMGNPARVMIVKALHAKGRCPACALIEQVPLSQSTISEHLRRLKEAGIVIAEIEGTTICYSVNDTALAWLRDHLTLPDAATA